MAAPIYLSDLIDIDLAETVTPWTVGNFGNQGKTASANEVMAMQGLNSISVIVDKSDLGSLFVNVISPIAAINNVGVHIFQWMFIASPGILETLQNLGAYTMAGNGISAPGGGSIGATTSANVIRYHFEGNDTYGASGRVAKCYTYKYGLAASSVHPYRTINGTPPTNPSQFGCGMSNIGITAKGDNLSADAVRYGTGGFVINGDVTTPATFSGFEQADSLIANRWGILTKLGGSFELQGKIAIGTNSNNGSAIPCHFDDSNTFISIVDTFHCDPTFNQITIDHGGTFCHWTNITIVSLGTISPGLIKALKPQTDFSIKDSAFISIGTTSLNTLSTASGTSWRFCDILTLNGANITDCILDRSSSTLASVSTKSVEQITNCSFVGTGSNHAVEIKGFLDQDNQLWTSLFDASTYATVDGSIGNEVVFVNEPAGITLRITIDAGAQKPTIRTAGATVIVIDAVITLKITVVDNTLSPISGAFVRITAAPGGPITTGTQLMSGLTDAFGVLSVTGSVSADQPISGWVRKSSPGDIILKQSIIVGTVSNLTGLDITVQMSPDV